MRQEPTTLYEPDGSLALVPAMRIDQGELVNTITHGFGLVMSVTGAVLLVARALTFGDPWRVAGCSIFAITLIAVYAASTLSHGVSEPRLRRRFRTLDQGLIYLLIAGTYTPFALAFLRTGWWWMFLVVMWTVAAFGFISKVWLSHRVEAISVWSYVLLGWAPVMPANHLMETVSSVALGWMLAGGLCYTLGIVFLIGDVKRFHFHAIWHVLVIAGSTCHYFVIFWFVAS